MNDLTQNEQLKNWIERIVMLPMRIRCRWRASAKRKVRIDTLKAVRRILQSATQIGAASTTRVFNVGLYLLLLDQDIAYFTDDLVCAIGRRRRAFLAKHEAILLYEAAEDLPQLLGREFREAVKAVGASDEQVVRLNSVSSALNQFRQRHRVFLGAIRNALAAHRDHDALSYTDALEALEPLEVMSRAAELSQLLNQLVGTIIELASLTVGTQALVRDMFSSSKRPQSG